MTILRNNLKRIFGKKINIIFMIVIPIIINVFTISVSTQEIKYDIGIVDNDESEYTKDLIKQLELESRVHILDPEDDIKDIVIKGTVDCAFVFESGFADKLIEGQDVTVKTYMIDGSNLAQPIQSFMETYISSSKIIAQSVQNDKDKFYEGIKAYNDKAFGVEYKHFDEGSEKIDTAVTSLGYLAFCMIFLMTFATTLILDDKKTGVFERISTTPTRKISYMVQHFISYFIIACIQIVIIILVLPNIVDVSFGNTAADVFKIGFICLLFSVVCISLSIAINRVAKTAFVANAINTIIDLPIIMLGGCFWSMDIMPESMQKIGKCMPTHWFMHAGEKVLYGSDLMDVGKDLLLMLILSVVLIVASSALRIRKTN